MNENSKKTILKKWWFWCIFIILVIGIVFAILFLTKNKEGNDFVTQKIEDLMLPEFNKTATASEKVLYDKNNVKITFKGISYTSYSADVNLEFENNNLEELEFIAGSVGLCKNSVNEFMIRDAYIRTEVEAGQKETDYIRFNYDSLNLYGIDEIAQVILNFDVSASDYNSDFENFYTDSLIIDTSLYNSYDFNNNSRYFNRITSKIIESKYNSKILQKDTNQYDIVDKLSIISMIRMENEDEEEIMMLEAKNDCGKDVKLEISDIKFNDKTIDSYSYDTADIINGKKSILDIDLTSLKNKDEANGVDNIETISFTVSILDSDYEEITSKKITYTISDN